jgi:polar amino acid transport system substrate-binding protein
LKGRKVCVSEGGLYVGTLAAKYGAIEMVYRAPADALIAVRIGECDATVHDSAMLEELIKYPEWKKFSARLPVGQHSSLVFVVPSSNRKIATFLKQVTNEWMANGYLENLMKTSVRSIAFEVYLDQAVPDCH